VNQSGNKWAILIGVDRYHESLGSLKYAGADCRALRDTLVSGSLGFPNDQVLLLDDSADADHRPAFANIHSFLGSWLSAPKEDDLVFVYFAGHGRLVDGKTYLVPGDATLSSIHTLGIPLSNVQDVLERCKAKRKLLVLDACHSGSGRDVAAMPGGMATALAAGTGFYTISSCGAEERSHEWDDVGHGVFSHFLAEALRGGCSPAADGRLTVDRLYEWVHDRVAKWAAQHRCAQTPQRFAQGAGTLVLAQSAPDHAALAEQYRREAEEAKARLAEIELRETKQKLERQTNLSCKANENELRGSDVARSKFSPQLQEEKRWWLFNQTSIFDSKLNELARCLAAYCDDGRVSIFKKSIGPYELSDLSLSGKRYVPQQLESIYERVIRGMSTRGFSLVGRNNKPEANISIYWLKEDHRIHIEAVAASTSGTVWTEL